MGFHSGFKGLIPYMPKAPVHRYGCKRIWWQSPVETWWHTVHGRGSEEGTGEWNG